MASGKTQAPVDTTAGTRAYHLATTHAAELAPRLPPGLLDALAADLTTLGADPRPRDPAAAPPSSPPRLSQALQAATTLITAIQGAVIGAAPKPEVLRAYGAKTKGGSLEAQDVVPVGEKILARALANPTEALSLGLLPADLDELTAALTGVRAAEEAARAKQAAGPTGKERRAAEARVKEAVARIAGAGALAFAKDPTLRAEFSSLN